MVDRIMGPLPMLVEETIGGIHGTLMADNGMTSGRCLCTEPSQWWVHYERMLEELVWGKGHPKRPTAGRAEWELLHPEAPNGR